MLLLELLLLELPSLVAESGEEKGMGAIDANKGEAGGGGAEARSLSTLTSSACMVASPAPSLSGAGVVKAPATSVLSRIAERAERSPAGMAKKAWRSASPGLMRVLGSYSSICSTSSSKSRCWELLASNLSPIASLSDRGCTQTQR